MPLNIKDAEVHRQARRLAELTGQSLTSAVRDAVAARLRQVETDRAAEFRTRSPETLLTLARDISRHFKDGEHSRDHAELYDKDGLPV